MTEGQWDPKKPNLLYARGEPKKQGGWLGWVIALVAIAALAAGRAAWKALTQ